MSGWGSPRSEEMDIGGRSPRNVGGREQDRASRRLGLTHSLTSPRTPEPKPELPSRPPPSQDSDDLPRPRSLSPRRTPAPPSVTGSALSARLERASFVRASNVPSGPPPPKTRARFSAKRGELDDEVGVDDGAAAGGDAAVADAPAVTPSGGGGGNGIREPLTPTPSSGGRGAGGGGGGGSGSRVTAMALAINSQRQQQQQDDEPPVMTLPAVITAAQAAGLAAEKRMRDNRHRQPSPPPSTLAIAEEEEEGDEVKAPAAGAGAGSAVAVGMGAKRVGRVRGRGALPAQREETFVGPRSAAGNSDVGNGSSVYGTGKSQIQASPQHWVPRKLSRSPLNKVGSSGGRGGKAASFSPPNGSSRPLW